MTESTERSTKMAQPASPPSLSPAPSVREGNSPLTMMGKEREGAASEANDVLLKRLICDHHARVYRYAYHLAGSAADAEDITQQTYMIAHQRLHQLRDEAKAESWLLSIVRTTFLKSIRRQRPVDAGSLELNVGEIPVEAVESPIDKERLEQSLQSLSDDYRTVLLMFYFEDASYQEIADQLQLPIGTVMSRLSRAKSKLRRAALLKHREFAADQGHMDTPQGGE